MKIWKRTVALILSLNCVFSLTACASTAAEEKNQTVQETESTDDTKELSNMAKQLAKAEYPVMAQYPETDGFHVDENAYEAWMLSRQEQRPENDEYQKGIKEFYQVSMREFLKDTGGQNKIYSPLNVYMALSMLAETTDGNSRQQILNLLGADNMEELRNNASVLWNANYCDDGTVTSLLASSAWLSDKITYNQETLNTLAKYYYASSFSGSMGSDEYNKMLQDWLNEQTGGLLKEQASQIEMTPATVLALATTVYFRAKWEDEFYKENNTQEIFHAVTGDVEAEFMHQSGTDYYYWGENFGAISRGLENSGEMVLILPDEDVTVESLLSDEEVMEFISSGDSWENSKFLIVNQSVPKFDVSSDFSLVDGLKKLGVTDVFDFAASDFSPLTTDTGVAVSEAKHAARVMIDEEGCLAAAFTVMMMVGAARPPEEQMDFVLDRPFLFVIKGQDNQPLFIGVVHQPN